VRIGREAAPSSGARGIGRFGEDAPAANYHARPRPAYSALPACPFPDAAAIAK
jgi:hypothetical protein